MRRIVRGHVLGYVLVGFVALLVGFAVGQATAPICHSVTEDSQILDCGYQDGAWHPL